MVSLPLAQGGCRREGSQNGKEMITLGKEMTQYPLYEDFSTLAIDIWGWIVLSCGGLSGALQKALQQPLVSMHQMPLALPPVLTTKNVSRRCEKSLCGQSHLFEKHSSLSLDLPSLGPYRGEGQVVRVFVTEVRVLFTLTEVNNNGNDITLQ